VVFDFDPELIFGTKARVPVVITIDGIKFKRFIARLFRRSDDGL
jgi:hypothetical protein